MLGNELVAALVVDASLLAAVHTADRESIGLVEERHRVVVLEFSVLDDQAMLFVGRVDRESSRPPIRAGIADEPAEPVLARRARTRSSSQRSMT